MAILTAKKVGLNMETVINEAKLFTAPQAASLGTATTFTVRYTVSGVTHDLRLTGTGFTYSGNPFFPSAGTITGGSYFRNGVEFLQIASTSMAVSVAQAYIDADDVDGLIAKIFVGTDTINGTTGAEVLLGFNGNDTIDGKAGADTMKGGLGNDIYVVNTWTSAIGTPRDNVVEAAGTGTGTDTVRSSVSYTLPVNVENLVLLAQPSGATTGINGTGNSAANSITGNALGNVLNGVAGNDTLKGGAGLDKVNGGAGNDNLYGGTGNDVLRGDDGGGTRGLDRFYFDTTPNAASNRDQILDFNVADDSIYLKKTVFSGIGSLGTLAPGAFHRIDGYNPASPGARTATTADDRIIWDQAGGKLYYDADGAGGAVAAVLFATMTPGVVLTNADFIVF